jgi:phosphoglycolate phosphatase-like HAD superfamily hydrolase
MKAPLLVLDFDGVICDSVDECFASSWTAYHELRLGHTGALADDEARSRFKVLRPFVRSGEDFVFIQEFLARGTTVSDQASFDAAARKGGEAARERYRELFYQARSELLRRDRAGWLALNRVYPHMKSGLSRLPPSAPPFVLSTKKPPFIAEILAANEVGIPLERIIWSDAEPKLHTAARLRDQAGSSEAVFIEDQVDAIQGNADPRLRPYLATWGYVKKEWLSEKRVALMTPEEFLLFVERELVDGTPAGPVPRA